MKTETAKQQYLSHQSALTDYEKMLTVGSGLEKHSAAGTQEDVEEEEDERIHELIASQDRETEQINALLQMVQQTQEMNRSIYKESIEDRER